VSSTLADVLSDKPIQRVEVKDEEVSETPPTETETHETPKETPPAEVPAEEVDKPTENAQARDESGKFTKTVPQEALHAERERRRALEAKLADLEKTEKPKTSVLENEDQAFNERLTEAVSPIRRQFFELSVELAREKPGREDYDEIYTFMNEECEKHPELVPQIVGATRPGEMIYQLGKTRKELAEVGGDITKLREHVTAKANQEITKRDGEIKALKAEISALKASQEKREKVPQSLNSESSAAVKDEAFKGPTPLKTVFN
jgi:hypothetical protein